LDWQEEDPTIKCSNFADDVVHLLFIDQLVSHAQAVHLRIERDRILVNARVFALHSDVVAAYLHAEQTRFDAKCCAIIIPTIPYITTASNVAV